MDKWYYAGPDWFKAKRIEYEDYYLKDNSIDLQTVEDAFREQLREYALDFWGDYSADVDSPETAARYNMLFWMLEWLIDSAEYYKAGGKGDYPFSEWISKERDKETEGNGK